MDVRRLIQAARGYWAKSDESRHEASPTELPAALVFSAVRDLFHGEQREDHDACQRIAVETYPEIFSRKHSVRGDDRLRKRLYSAKITADYPGVDKETRRSVAARVVKAEHLSLGVHWLLRDEGDGLSARFCFESMRVEFEAARRALGEQRTEMWKNNPHRVWLSDEWLDWVDAL